MCYFRRGHNFIPRLGNSFGSKVISGHAVAQLVETMRRNVVASIPDGFIGIPH